MFQLTYEQFKKCTRSHEAFAQRYWPLAQQYMPQHGILLNAKRVAGFLATISVESSRLEATEESLYYKDPLRMAKIFKRAFDLNHDKEISPDEVAYARQFIGKPEKLAKVLYNGFPGRGLIQLTWEENYRKYMEYSAVDVISKPELLALPEDAFRSACWYWLDKGCNEAADTGSMKAITLLVNGKALMALEERTEVFNSNLLILGA